MIHCFLGISGKQTGEKCLLLFLLGSHCAEYISTLGGKGEETRKRAEKWHFGLQQKRKGKNSSLKRNLMHFYFIFLKMGMFKRTMYWLQKYDVTFKHPRFFWSGGEVIDGVPKREIRVFSSFSSFFLSADRPHATIPGKRRRRREKNPLFLPC